MDTNKAISKRATIVQALRRLWLRSRERATALKIHAYTCERCQRKKTVKKGEEVKVEVHHREGINNWDDMINSIRLNLLVSPEKLEVLCKECHKQETFKKSKDMPY